MSQTKKEDIMTVRHSMSHVLAQAVLHLYPKAKLAIGPATDEGFYYDIDFGHPLNPEDLKKIEEEMKKCVREDNDFKGKKISKAEAKKMYKGNPYKLELIDGLKDGEISLHTHGDFTDLCRGGHVKNTKTLRHFKLMQVAGAYWRGDSKNKMLQRIYGVVFHEKDELKKYLHMLEEAAKRDHRKLGKELDLFSFNEISPGSPFFHPKGTIVYKELQQFLREKYTEWGYSEVITPLVYHKELWETSGHWEHYHNDMFQLQMDNQDAALKPMNCPSHILIYKTQSRSYQDLPLRIADFAPLHRNELKGVLGGLTRVRKFSQDDCHVFCTPEQIKDEIKSLITNVHEVYKKIFGFEFSVELSTRPENSMGTPKQWKEAEKSLKDALEECKVDYTVNPGDGAFYGPKIDFHIKDSLGRSWQCATEQLDFQMPERFGIEYMAADGRQHRVVMLHRTVIGSLERFMGILLEHYAGKFPLWLSPVQVKVLTIADRFNKYGETVAKELVSAGLRVEMDERQESISKKVRDAQKAKINYIIVIGEKEVKDKTVTVRTRDNKVHPPKKLDTFIKELNNEIESRK